MRTSDWILQNCRFAQAGSVISFDFDDTLTRPVWDAQNGAWSSRGPNPDTVELLKDLHAQGNTIVVVTSRHEDEENKVLREGGESVHNFIRAHGLPVSKVYFTNGEPKGPLLAMLGVSRHYDDSLDEIRSAHDHAVDGQRVRHPGDEVVETGRLPKNPSLDQVRFWEWHQRNLKGQTT